VQRCRQASPRLPHVMWTWWLGWATGQTK
jgi:hypothetical protein